MFIDLTEESWDSCDEEPASSYNYSPFWRGDSVSFIKELTKSGSTIETRGGQTQLHVLLSLINDARMKRRPLAFSGTLRHHKNYGTTTRARNERKTFAGQLVRRSTRRIGCRRQQMSRGLCVTSLDPADVQE